MLFCSFYALLLLDVFSAVLGLGRFCALLLLCRADFVLRCFRPLLLVSRFLRCTAVQMQTVEDAQEESGWKLVHGDVFRPPSLSPMLLAVMCGTGMQVLAMTLSTITFAFLGFLSPANR